MGNRLESANINRKFLNEDNNYCQQGLCQSQGYNNVQDDMFRVHIRDLYLTPDLGDMSINGGVFSFCGIYDGHGSGGDKGGKCNKSTEFVYEKLGSMLQKFETGRLRNLKKEPPMRLFDDDETIINCHLECDKRLRKHLISGGGGIFGKGLKVDESGCQSNVVLLVPYKDETESKDECIVEVIVCNVGMCRAVLYNKGRSIPLSDIHDIESNEEELSRIRGLKVMRNELSRLKTYEYSRSFGDVLLKNRKTGQTEQILVPIPSIYRYDVNTKELGIEDRYIFIVQACSGVWDLATVDFVKAYVKRRLKEQENGVYYSKRMFRLKNLYRKNRVKKSKVPEEKEEIAKDGIYDLGSIAEEMMEYLIVTHKHKGNLTVNIILLRGEWECFKED